MHRQKIKLFSVLLIISILLLASCGNNVKEMVAFLDEKEAVYEDISVQMGETYWNLYSDEDPVDLKTPKEGYTELYNNDTLNSIVNEWYPKRSSLKDKVLARRLEIWHNILTAAKINYSEDNLKIQNELEFWLGEDDSTEGKPSEDELTGMVIRLMKQRNEQAKIMGYNNYAELMLEITETGYKWLENLAATIDARTFEPFQQLKDEYLESTGKTEFTNKDARGLAMQFYINQITPDLSGDTMRTAMKEIVDGIGLVYDNLPFRAVENQMPPGVGGQGIAVQIPNDFRIALMPGLGLDTWMHELGHGLHAMHTTVESPILKGYEWSFGSGNGGFSEGMAETSARFTRLPSIAKQFSDQSDEEISEKITTINKYFAAYLRYWLSIFMFEVEYYKNIDQDPIELQHDLMVKYRLLDVKPENAGRIVDMVYVSYPLYTQSYVIADVISWQIHNTLQETFGESYAANPKVGQFLIDNLYNDGTLTPWQQRLKKVTGRELDLEGYLTFYGL